MRPLDQEQSWLYGYAVSGVAGIAADSEAAVGPLAKMNFLVGRNNHGKSTLMRAAAEWTSVRSGSPLVGRRRTLIPLERAALARMLNSCGVNSRDDQESRLSGFVPLDPERVGVWAERSTESNTTASLEPRELSRPVKQAMQLENYSVQYQGEALPHVAARSVFIPAFRQMREAPEGKSNPDLASGEGLVAELSRWERPRIRTSPLTRPLNGVGRDFGSSCATCSRTRAPSWRSAERQIFTCVSPKPARCFTSTAWVTESSRC